MSQPVMCKIQYMKLSRRSPDNPDARSQSATYITNTEDRSRTSKKILIIRYSLDNIREGVQTLQCYRLAIADKNLPRHPTQREH
jgi:hypothetical protein